MKISIILPVYNAEKYIARTISSVLNQTHHEFELIIVDDCSIDKSREIICEFKKCDSRIKYFSTQINSGGPAKPRNMGIKQAKYDWIAFIDSDDIWHKDKLKWQCAFLENNINIRFIASKKKVVKNHTSIQEFQLTNYNFSIISFYDLLKKNIINNSSVLVSKSLLMPFYEDTKFIAVEDAIQWLGITKKGVNCVLLDEKLYFYLKRNNSISANKIKMLKKRVYILKEIFRRDAFSVFKIAYYTFSYIIRSIVK